MDSISTARNFFINQQGLSPDQADMLVSKGMEAYNQQSQPQNMMQMASGGIARLGYQMGGSPEGVQTMPMDTGQSLQVPQQMPTNFSSAQSITMNPLLNYGQPQIGQAGGTPLSMNRGGIARLGYESGGVTIPSQGSELSQIGQMDPAQAVEVITKLLIENGVPPEQAQQLALQIIQIFAQGGAPAVEAFADQLEQEEVQAMASGGIAGYAQRQGYLFGGIGKAISGAVKGVTKAVSGVVKGVANAVKSVVKSDIGKLALLAGGAYLMMNPAMLSGLGAGAAGTAAAAETAALSQAGLGGLGASAIAPEVAALGSFAAPTAASAGAGITAANLANTSLAIPSATSITSSAATTPGFFESVGQGFKDFAANPIGKLGEYGSQALQYAKDNKLNTALTAVNLASLGATLGMPRNEGEDDMSYEKRLQEAQGYLTNYGRNLKITNPYFYQREGAVNPFAPTMAANGGIMGYAKGGSMVPPARQIEGGVIELDARKSGGYIPYGKKERVDDVPAMLAKDEFVFTSRAVKAAGGGSAQKGAEKMYALMKQLESKGARA
jgi:hypothetical protein